MLNFWITADLAAYTANHLRALRQILKPASDFMATTAIFVNFKPWDEWGLSMPYDPSLGEPDTGEATATTLARQYVGDSALDVSLIFAGKWTINQVYSMQMHKGRVVIAGNAAYRHPLAGGWAPTPVSRMLSTCAGNYRCSEPRKAMPIAVSPRKAFPDQRVAQFT